MFGFIEFFLKYADYVYFDYFIVRSCPNATYLISIFNEIEQVLSEIKNPINKKTITFSKQAVPRISI